MPAAPRKLPRAAAAGLLLLALAHAAPASGQGGRGRVPAEPVRLETVTVTGRARALRVAGSFRQAPGELERPVTAEGGTRRIVVRGAMPTAPGCAVLAAGADRDLRVVTLFVEARPAPRACRRIADAHAYDVTVRGLPPGVYTLRVVHTYRDESLEPELALETPVTVR